MGFLSERFHLQHAPVVSAVGSRLALLWPRHTVERRVANAFEGDERLETAREVIGERANGMELMYIVRSQTRATASKTTPEVAPSLLLPVLTVSFPAASDCHPDRSLQLQTNNNNTQHCPAARATNERHAKCLMLLSFRPCEYCPWPPPMNIPRTAAATAPPRRRRRRRSPPGIDHSLTACVCAAACARTHPGPGSFTGHGICQRHP